MIRPQILIINIDSKIENLALKKIESFYTKQGYEVVWDLPIFKKAVEKVFVSCVFDWNRYKCKEFENVSNCEIGGSGYDLKKTLPSEIECEKVLINWGFTTRGCIRRCFFCIVPEKEGPIQIVGDIYDFWDRKSKHIKIMDNNILAAPEHFITITDQVIKERLIVDFNQGLDHRLLSPVIIDRIKLLQAKRLLHKNEPRFAWDCDTDYSVKFESLYSSFGRCSVYVLVGNVPFEDSLEKLNILRLIGHNVFVMRLREISSDPRYIRLAQWGNLHWAFRKYTFDEFLKIRPLIQGL